MILSVPIIALAALLTTDSSRAHAGADTQHTAFWRTVTQDTVRTETADTGRAGNAETFNILHSQDTLPRRRAVVHYSDGYGTRATIHRRLSYAMLPLFALSYFTGDKLFDEGPDASRTVINLHRISATSVSVLFTVNTITGGINLWQGRHDPIQRKRKLVHAALFAVASAGFTYAGVSLSEQAERSLDKRREHRTVNLVSMGLSTASVAVMMFGHD